MFASVSKWASADTYLEETERNRNFFVTGLHTATPHAKAESHPFLSVCRAILWSGTTARDWNIWEQHPRLLL